ncbi:MAG TPA: DUF2905 domain-containing protein [Deltaproteobacteria bacterium]|nr:DUF2905 domain-containing protein [Deltaproteobacteria bacterium]
MKDIGLILMAGGVILIAVGLTLNLGIIPWGRLPGDIRIARPGMHLYFPLATCVLISLAVSLAVFVMRLFK